MVPVLVIGLQPEPPLMDDSHLITFPVWPESVRMPLLLPVQTAALPETVPPTLAAVTEKVAALVAVPLGVVTLTLPEETLLTIAMIWVAVNEVTEETAVVPILTFAAVMLKKFVPVIVIEPPVHISADKEEIVGVGIA